MKKLLTYLLCGVLLFSCGVQRPSRVSEGGGEPTGMMEVPDSLRATYHYIEGVRLWMCDSIEAAEEQYWAALSADSLHAPSLYELAMLAVERDSLQLANELSRKALAVDSTDLWYRVAVGRTFLMMERYSEALPEFKKIVAQAPTDPENYHLLAAIYNEMEMPFSAIEVLDSAELRTGLYPELHFNKCVLMVRVGQMDKACAELERYRANFPYDLQAGMLLASVYEYLGRDSLYVGTLREILTVDPTNPEVLMRLYEAARGEGKESEFLQRAVDMVWSDDIGLGTKAQIVEELTSDAEFCKRHFPQLTELTHALVTQYPEVYRAVELHALFVMRSGSYRSGVDLVKGFFHRHPDNAQALELIVDFEGLNRNYDSVMHYYRMHRAALPESVEPVVMLASLEQYVYQNPRAADKLYRQALRLADNDSLRSSIVGMRGDLQHAEGRKAEAYRLYDKALKLLPDNMAVLNNYAYFLSLDSVQLSRAEQMAERAVQLSPSNATYLDTYAWVLFKLGRTDQALKIIKQAVSLDQSNSTELLVHYGDILYATGEKFMARMYWRRALNAGHDAVEIQQRLKLP